MIDQRDPTSTRRRPGPPSEAIEGMANALIRALHRGGGDVSTQGDDERVEVPHMRQPLQLGRFEVEGELGSGAMGVVYAARDPVLRRDIAVKIVAPERVTDVAMRRARREAQAMAQVSHPNVVKVFAIGEHEGALFVAMERIYGQTLAQWQASEPSAAEVLEAYHQAGRGLAELHAHGLVHRDFKPANAMRGEDGVVRVLDLGLVREQVLSSLSEAPALHSDEHAISGSTTQSGAVMGTPAYMAPEQFLGEAATPAADQFSFCVALYEALYGTRPFQGRTMVELVDAIAEQRIAPPPEGSAVPRRVYRALRRGLAREPSRRHPSMARLLDALGTRRRKGLWLGAGAAVVVAGVLATVGSRGSVDCRSLERFEQVWTPSREALVRERAGDEQSVDAVAAYVDEVEGIVREACETEGAVERRACNLQLVARLEASIDALAEGEVDPGVVAGSLPEPGDCMQGDVLPRNPDDVLLLAAITQEAHMITLTGDYARADEIAGEAIAVAQRLGDPLSLQEGFFSRGKVRARKRDLPGAIADFTAAYSLSMSMQKYFGVVNSAVALVWLTLEARDLDAAEHWARVATVTMEAQQLYRARGTHARVLQRVGEVALARGDYAAARSSLIASLTIWEERENHREVATVLANVVETDLRRGALAEAEAEARRSLELLRTRFGDDEPQLATAHLNLGNVLRRYGRVEEALAAHTEALRRQRALYGSEHFATASVAVAQAGSLLEVGRAAEAQRVLEQALPQLPSEDVVGAQGAVWLGRALSEQGRHVQALERAAAGLIALESELRFDHVLVAEVRGDVARVKLAAGQAGGAREAARAGRASLERDGTSLDLVAWLLGIEGDAARALQDAAAAREAYARGLKLAEASLGADAPRTTALRTALERI